MSASDVDHGENAQLTYSIVGGNVDSAFSVDATGTLRTNAQLDREILDAYALTVIATDAGTPPLSGQTHINITGLSGDCVIMVCSFLTYSRLSNSRSALNIRPFPRKIVLLLNSLENRC